MPGREDDDFDADAFLAAWDAASEAAAAIVVTALADEVGRPPPQPDLRLAAGALRAGVESGRRPFGWIAAANGWVEEAVPDDDREAVIWAAGAFLIMEEDPGLEPGDAAVVLTLEFGDWIGAVLGLVRTGPGADASPRALVEYISACPEIPGEVGAGSPAVEAAFEVIVPSWEAAGATGADRRLTRLGTWILPRMLTLAWGVDFDAARGAV